MRVLDTRDADLPEGLDVLTGYITMIAPRLRVTGPERARGVLLVGPPGTGKTMLARAIGRLVDLPVVEFRISALMTSLLGETEQRFAQAFATLEAMAPNVVFVDEIEKAFGDQSERDGGTMMRCTGALLSWLSDNQNPNFIVATSNNLSRMGEIGMTMTRAERFDASFFVDVPAEAARRVMLTRWLGPGFFSSEIIGRLAADTPRFSGADLRSVVKIARMRAESAGRPLSEEDLQWEVARRRDRVQGLYDEFMPLRRWGAMYCDTASTHRDA
jgi:SpoVK/Ycf46/Vps4 family AAA+-type ATPase